jgi:hypothetical protein
MEMGKITKHEVFRKSSAQYIESMDVDEHDKYRGVSQSTVTDHTEVKVQITSKYKSRLIRILETGLNTNDKTKAINTYAIPETAYSFGLIKWNDNELEVLNTLTGETSSKYLFDHKDSPFQGKEEVEE